MKIPYNLVRKFLNRYAIYRGHDMITNRDTWVADYIVISINKNTEIDYDQLELIAIEQLGIGILEFDYWLGQNAIS